MQPGCRRATILQVIVEAYIHNAQPVSSATVARRHPELDLSSATIRSVMGELEAEGLLRQPHASAGRVPTERGLRTYVDTLVRPKLRPRDRTRLDATTRDGDTAAFPALLGHTLAALAGQPVMVAVPCFLGSRLREVGLVRCDAGRFLAYFVSPNGMVQQKLVEVDFDLDPDELVRVANYLNERLGNRTLAQVRRLVGEALAQAQACRDDLQARAMAIGARLLPEVRVEVRVEGTAHLAFQPEFADVRKLRAVLRTIEAKEALLQLLDGLLGRRGAAGEAVQVMLGSEHGLQGGAELACVAGTVEGLEGRHTALSLFGPSRMDYGRLVPLVAHATGLFARFWERI